MGLYLLVLYRTAWLSDDAYITYRSIDNLLNGFGLTFNPGQRVQAFTHPLWALLHIPFVYASGEVYYTGLSVSMGISVLAVWLLLWRFRKDGITMAFLLVAMISSMAFMDFSTSGLENPMTNLLLVIFCAIFFTQSGKYHLFWLSLVAGCMLFNRMDTILLVAPALVWAWWPDRSWKTCLPIGLGLLPFLLWEGFAIIYYGFPFPMSAYAKLNTGIDHLALLQQGGWYFLESLRMDPVSLLVILGGILLPWWMKKQTFRSLSVGLGLYLAYILYIGGDFMSGRFFCSPYFLALIILAFWVKEKGKLYLIPIIFLIGILQTASPIRSHADFGIDRTHKLTQLGPHGISNERAFYFQGTGLIAAKGREMPNLDFVEEGKRLSQHPGGFFLTSNMGIIPYYSGPKVHFLDRFALTDPFLAHLPSVYHPNWMPGHNFRLIPRGYIKSIEQKKNLLHFPELRELYEATESISRAPIWDKERWRYIWEMNVLKRYTSKIDKAYFRMPVAQTLDAMALSALGEDSLEVFADGGVEIQFMTDTPPTNFKVSLQNNCGYNIIFRYGTEIIQGNIIPPKAPNSAFTSYDIAVPLAPVSNVVICHINVQGACQVKGIQF